MKIRTDFVTNSSSSSFILNFTDEGSILNELVSSLSGCNPKCLGILLSDIADAPKCTVKDALKMINKKSEDVDYSNDIECVLNDLYYETEYYTREMYKKRNPDASRDDCYEWVKTDEGRDYVDNEYEDTISKLKNCDPDSIIVCVEYEDHTEEGYELEKEILPRCDRMVLMVSNH